MPVDVRINEITTEVSVTDGAALLTPQMLEMIVQAVLRRLAEQKRDEANQARERTLGAARQTEAALPTDRNG